jgi:hypothetical protein
MFNKIYKTDLFNENCHGCLEREKWSHHYHQFLEAICLVINLLVKQENAITPDEM